MSVFRSLRAGRETEVRHCIQKNTLAAAAAGDNSGNKKNCKDSSSMAAAFLTVCLQSTMLRNVRERTCGKAGRQRIGTAYKKTYTMRIRAEESSAPTGALHCCAIITHDCPPHPPKPHPKLHPKPPHALSTTAP
jgi:hypothetical protein